jgi:hypothetical protein
MKDPVLIETIKGLGTVDKIYVSELGYLMLRIYFENGTFTTYNLGKHDPENNMFTDKIMKDEKVNVEEYQRKGYSINPPTSS